MSSDILIVDDEEDIRNLVKGILEDEGYATHLAANASEAYEKIEASVPDLIVLDIWLQDSEHDGLKILKTVKKQHPHVPVIMISGHGTIETAVSSIKEGAYDFIEKPFKATRLLLMIKRALEAAALRRENETLKQTNKGPSELIGSSSAMQQLKQLLDRVAPTNSRVLLTGEPGTGKDVAARVVYQLSERSNKPFLALNCATLAPELLEEKLFGISENSKGGTEEVGIFEQANGGTLFLDEVADMPLETQGKILRVLQEQRFQKLGSDKFIEVDVRILASSNRNLEEEINNGNFREDLYYRLNVVPIHIPPLREYRTDIPALVDYFLEDLGAQSGLSKKRFSDSALDTMQNYEWPGNVRQLRNAVEWALIMNSGGTDELIDTEHLPPEIKKGKPHSAESRDERNSLIHDNVMELSLREAREVFEKKYLMSQVERFGGNISKTAEFIGMERSALHRKLKSLQILKNDKESDLEGTLNEKRKRA